MNFFEKQISLVTLPFGKIVRSCFKHKSKKVRGGFSEFYT